MTVRIICNKIRSLKVKLNRFHLFESGVSKPLKIIWNVAQARAESCERACRAANFSQSTWDLTRLGSGYRAIPIEMAHETATELKNFNIL